MEKPALDGAARARLEHTMSKDDSPPPTKAERAASVRAKRKAAQEAAALRANLLRRKAQTRARAATPAEREGAEKCR